MKSTCRTFICSSVSCGYIQLITDSLIGSVSCPKCGCASYPTVQLADPINHPPHYTSHPSGIECIQITEHMGFNLGNAMKYIWRADEKGNAVEDLQKAVWYIRREIVRRDKKIPTY